MLTDAAGTAGTADPAPLNWTTLGTPGRKFGFSADKRSFLSARAACGARPGTVRLAVLDTLLEEVAGWAQANHSQPGFWVDASRPKSDTSEI